MRNFLRAMLYDSYARHAVLIGAATGAIGWAIGCAIGLAILKLMGII